MSEMPVNELEKAREILASHGAKGIDVEKRKEGIALIGKVYTAGYRCWIASVLKTGLLQAGFEAINLIDDISLFGG